MIPDIDAQDRHRAAAAEFTATRSKRLSNAHFRIGLPQWEDGVIGSALEVYDLTIEALGGTFGPVVSTLRDTFETEAREAFAKMPSRTSAASIEQWVANASFNAAAEAVARAAGRAFTVERCATHQETEFSAADPYPGHPGTPGWLRCACKLHITTDALTAAGEETQHVPATPGNISDPGLEPGETPKAAVVVLLPRPGDPVTQIASGVHPHTTLLYGGDGTMDLSELCETVAAIAKGVGHPMTDKVSGRGVLGSDSADVLLLDASGSGTVRSQLLTDPAIGEFLAMQEQFPAWIPHLTLGYPSAPSTGDEVPEDVTYDRLAVWRGEEMYEFPLGGITAEDALTAAVPTEADLEADQDLMNLEAAETKLEEEAFNPHVPWHGVLVVEGTPTGDNRLFSANALTHRVLPLPLKCMFKDAAGHDESRIVGRIDRLWRDGNRVWGEGIIDDSEDAYEALRQLANGMLRGTSIDVDSAVEVANEQMQEYAEARLSASTLCAIPAFAEAFVSLGPAPENANVAPAGGYWVDGPGGQKIAWGTEGDLVRARNLLGRYMAHPQWAVGLAASLRARAIGQWPGQQSADLAGANPTNQIPDGALVASVMFADEAPPSADFFRNPSLEGPTPITVTDEGRVFGHVATWGTCHIGYPGQCVTPPHSKTNYSYFHTGAVHTDAGPVPVGQISLGGGHASLKDGLRAALSHYDSTSTAVADVTAGEDAHGIWVSGKLREGVTPKQVRDLQAAALSGDWREAVVNGQRGLEMVAALAVNVPGFPIPRAGMVASGQVSLVAAAPVMPYTDKMEVVNEARSFFRSLEIDTFRAELDLIGD